MVTQASMLSLFNAALSSQGQDEVSENDGSNEYRVLARKWPLIIEAELEDGLYHFTREQAFVVTRTDGKFGYDDAYLVPPEALFVRRVWTETNGVRDTTIDWVQDSAYVHVCATDGIYMEFVTVAGEDLWSANFSAGVTAKLEAVILRALKEEYSEADGMEMMAESYFQRARTHASKSRSAKEPFKRSRLAASRFSRG